MRFRQGVEQLRVFLLIEDRQAGPALGMSGFADQCPLERRAKPAVFFGSEVLAKTEEADHQLADRQLVRVAVFE
jgi:hypothetical protein